MALVSTSMKAGAKKARRASSCGLMGSENPMVLRTKKIAEKKNHASAIMYVKDKRVDHVEERPIVGRNRGSG